MAPKEIKDLVLPETRVEELMIKIEKAVTFLQVFAIGVGIGALLTNRERDEREADKAVRAWLDRPLSDDDKAAEQMRRADFDERVRIEAQDTASE